MSEVDYKDLVAQYEQAGGKVTKCPPANGGNNEAHPTTLEHIAKIRADWIKKNG